MRVIRIVLIALLTAVLYECLVYGNESGRTHDTNADWNHWYDTGMNHADFLAGREGESQ